MKLFAIPFFILAILGVAFLAGACRSPTSSPPDSRHIDDFRLPDHRGLPHSLRDLADKKLVVVVFLGTACPLAKSSAPMLAELVEIYGPRGVGFLAIDANAHDTPADVEKFVRNCGLPFPMLRDTDQTVADLFGAERTPEAFVLDVCRDVRYRGRIAAGKEKVSRRDLAEALEDLLAGRAVARPHVAAVGCRIGRRPRTTREGAVTYANRIRPILDRRCGDCHRAGEIAPFALAEWKDVAAWSATIREVVAEGRMPPWHADPRFGRFRNDARLSEEEKRLLLEWIDDGCPEGAPRSESLVAPFAKGWRIPEPDLVLWMSEQQFRVPPHQTVEYQYFLVDPGFREDKFIQAAEVRPGNREVVHHAPVSLVLPHAEGELPDSLGAMLNFVPGMQPTQLPPGSAIHVPAGSKFLFQMHYTPNGKEHADRSRLGLVFANPGDVKQRVRGGAVVNPGIDIPAGAKRHRETAEHVFARNTHLLSLSPHMHVRGKSFRIEAAFPDGHREILLDVPRYDFHWQLRYDLAEPRRLPAGTRLICTATYDNSADNPANPNSLERVRWGDQTWDEMLIGFLTFVEETACP